MDSNISLRSRSSASKMTANSSVNSGAKSVKRANASTLSKFSATASISSSSYSNGSETPKSHQPHQPKNLGPELLQKPPIDTNEYKEIVSKLKRATSQEILAYYNKFGSMWFNEFPKTDYLYSPTSENYGREVAPGIPLKPNMSRSPIRSYSESLPKSRKDTVDSSYEPTIRSWIPLDAESRVNLTNELKEKFLLNRSSERSSYSSTQSKFSQRWYQKFTLVFTILYSYTLGRIFSRSRSRPGYRSPYANMYQNHYNSTVSSDRWYYALSRFLYRSLFLFQRIDVKMITAARSTVSQVLNPIITSSRNHLKPFAVLALCLPLVLLFVLYWWPGTYVSLRSYIEEIFVVENSWKNISKSVAFVSSSISSWISDLSVYVFLRPLVNFYEFIVWGLLSAGTLVLSTVAYVLHLAQTGIFSAFSFIATPVIFLFSAINESSSALIQNIKSRPYQFSTSMQSPDIDYKILAENIVKSSEVQNMLNEWLSEQSVLLEKNQKQSKAAENSFTEADKTIASEKFKEFLIGELNSRESKNKQNMQQTIEEKNAILKEELRSLEKELRDRKEAQTVAQAAIYDDLVSKINDIQNQLKWQALRLRRCCSKKPPDVSARTVEKHVVAYLSKLLSASKEPLSQDDIKSHLDAIYVARDKLEHKLSNLTYHLDHRIREASEASMDMIMAAVSERMGDELSKRVHDIVSVSGTSDAIHFSSFDTNSLQQYINRTIDHVLSLYDADKTGMADYALESSGGTVLNIKCTESTSSSPAVFYFYGIPVWWTSNNPRKAIQPGMQPGECWSFVGSTGYLVIQLSAMIKIHTFSMEHIPKSLSRYGNIDSAPRDFSVWGLKEEKDKGPLFLGKFRYEENGTSLQYFSAQPHERPFNIVELQIESNWGNLEYTCLYRFRVHGVPV